MVQEQTAEEKEEATPEAMPTNDWLRPYPGWRKRLAKALGTPQADLFPDEKRV
ncbi:MAG: hypothetical protein KAT75_03430 [Dehalococcoidia bacterium]|nr:hypothetical protein [Dehalococcoidia bacterium]